MAKQNVKMGKQAEVKKRKTRNNNFVEEQPNLTTSSAEITKNQNSNIKKSSLSLLIVTLKTKVIYIQTR